MKKNITSALNKIINDKKFKIKLKKTKNIYYQKETEKKLLKNFEGLNMLNQNLKKNYS